MCLDRKDGKLLWQQGPTWSEPDTVGGGVSMAKTSDRAR